MNILVVMLEISPGIYENTYFNTLSGAELMQITMINDKIVPTEQVDPIYFDRGIFFGDGVYEVIRSYNHKIFALDDHMERFARSLAAIDIRKIDVENIREKVIKAFQKANIADAKIYFHVTRGSAPRDHNWDEHLNPNFFLNISPIGDYSHLKENGVKVSVYPDLRWKRCDVKSLNLLANVLAHQDAHKKGCFDAILVNEEGFITEGSSSAFFQIFGNKLYTSALSANILPSVTRKYVFKAAENTDLQILEKSIKPERAKQADELFVAVTTKDILSVVEFDGKKIAEGKIGNYTRQLIENFKEFTG